MLVKGRVLVLRPVPHAPLAGGRGCDQGRGADQAQDEPTALEDGRSHRRQRLRTVNLPTLHRDPSQPRGTACLLRKGVDTGERHASDLKPGLPEQQSLSFPDIWDDSNHLIKAKTKTKNHMA